MTSNIIILLGKSASGKTSQELLLRQNGFDNLITYTTRSIRDGEVNGKDYHFVSVDEFNNLNLPVKYIVSDTWKYGIHKNDAIGTKIFSCISESYALDISKHFDNVKVIYFNISREERFKRLLERGDSKESIEKRFEIEDREGDINVHNFSSLFEVNNGDLTEIYDNIIKYIRS